MENEEKNQTEQSDKSRSVWRELWDYAKIIIAVFVIAFLLGHFVYILSLIHISEPTRP